MQIIHSDAKELLTISEAAKAGHLSVSTLRRYEKQGLIKPLRTLGNHRRYRHTDVQKLIRGEVATGTDAPLQAGSGAATASEKHAG